MTNNEIAWEAVKLMFQGVVALGVARLAVRWALSRFKQEKIWERRLAAQSDIIVALAEMRRQYSRWIDEIELHSRTTDEADREHNERFRAAKRKLEEAMPLAQLLLPQETSDLLHTLERKRDNIHGEDPYEHYNQHYGLLTGAITELVTSGRQLLP